ncbi:aminoglycoside N(3)-acetyltransferase [Sporosarcina beigongshangi]|uniref:aminoglycoside N(3)-acetyltransferase n=1 Tax=Sporosarcina beigongshangi TaxID=2782538 RepID=UPI001939AA6A|nr:AAC(3) family N-acetyltransferase [Sporosarcina beigongshangi]
MSELKTIQRTHSFQSKAMLQQQLQTLGIQAGDNIIVHASLQSMGWIAGGAQTVVEALMETVTSDGTIIMPAQSADNSEPSNWKNPPVPEEWYEHIRQSLPAYDPHLSSLRGMGKIAECFHRHPATIRSAHPTHSFMAWGQHAKDWMNGHFLHDSFGMTSPLGKMFGTDVKIVMIGVDYDTCTALHLAEYRAPGLTTSPDGAAVLLNGERVWATYDMAHLDSDFFPNLVEAFTEVNPEVGIEGLLGLATCKIMPMTPLIEFGTDWIAKKRMADAAVEG